MSADGTTKKVEIAVPLKYLDNFWRTLKMSLINCEVNLIVTWTQNWVISSVTRKTKFATTYTKPYVPAETLSTQNNAKVFGQLNSGFKRAIIWKKYQSKKSLGRQNP